MKATLSVQNTIDIICELTHILSYFFFIWLIVKPDGSRILQLWDRMIAVAFHRLCRWWIWWRSLHSRGAPDVCSEGCWVMLGVCASRTIIINIFWQTWCLQESVQQCLIGKVASSVLRWFGGRSTSDWNPALGANPWMCVSHMNFAMAERD